MPQTQQVRKYFSPAALVGDNWLLSSPSGFLLNKQIDNSAEEDEGSPSKEFSHKGAYNSQITCFYEISVA
ncbi:hypothetical protein L6164_036577 [Bauhinia variegata]|uniref:Uncharacterized protein n=1 Tax=Bauhinia variegata TaxID=167791 RepID=A0ACB9KHK1_BAUVA|nr:hypothetical protein L6164_036577 [Bauhinia variegata]